MDYMKCLSSADRKPRLVPMWSSAFGVIALLAVAFYLVFMPKLPALPLYGNYNHQRLFVLLLLVAICGLTLGRGATRKDWLQLYFFLSMRTRMLLLALLLVGVCSSVLAVYPWFALLEVAHFALMFLAAVSLAVIRVNLGSLFDRLLAVTMVLVGGVYLLIYSAGYYWAAVSYDFDLSLVHKLLFNSFSNVRFFSQWQSWTLPLMVLPLLLVRRACPWRLALLLPAAGWWLLLFMTATRGTTLGCMVAVVLTLLFYRRQALPWLRWHLLAMVSGLAAYLTLHYGLPLMLVGKPAVVESVFDRALSGLSGREPLWSEAWEMTVSHPLLGVGPMHYADYAMGVAAHPHNALLQISAEWGVPALLIVLALFSLGLVLWLRNDYGVGKGEDETARLRPALFAALITAAVHSLFSGIIVMPISQLMMTLVLGWMLGIAYIESPKLEVGAVEASSHSPRAHFFVLLFFTLVLLGIAKPLSVQIPILERVHQEYREESLLEPVGYFRPRFWLQGYPALYDQEKNHVVIAD
ncbi:O-antigen ligase family protein [Desulfurivibrio sp. C05AmB]|uniref:O-antigen ligase family protein n=1 Tax=Desulfurivibrio sp. C05AmB TaxID=3374371 RepID=UPI00376EE5DE